MSFKETLKAIGKAIAWPFRELVRLLFTPYGEAALKQAYDELTKTPLGQIVIQTVDELATGHLSDEEKLKTAFSQIVIAAERQKLTWKASLIHLAIEIAVQALKNAW